MPFETKSPSEAVMIGRSKLDTLVVLKNLQKQQPPSATQKQVDLATTEAEKTILPLEEELGLQRDERTTRLWTTRFTRVAHLPWSMIFTRRLAKSEHKRSETFFNENGF